MGIQEGVSCYFILFPVCGPVGIQMFKHNKAFNTRMDGKQVGSYVVCFWHVRQKSDFFYIM